MKDCCRPDERPGPVKRVLNKLTAAILILLLVAAVVSLFI